MAILKVAWAGIKKRKVYSISILLLVLMIAILLNTGISLMQRTSQIYDETHKRTNAYHMQYYFKDMYGEKVKSFEKWFENDNRIREVKVNNVLILQNGAYNFKNKGEAEFEIHLYPNTEKYMNIYNEVNDVALDYDEVVLPSYYQDTYDLKEGDSFEITVGDITTSLTVNSFFVDPIQGSNMIGIKKAVINSNRLADMIEVSRKIVVDSPMMKEEYSVGIVVKDQFVNSIKEINEDFYVNNDVPMNESYSFEMFRTGTLMMANVILSVIIAFSILLLLIIILVIRGAINSAIETDFTNIGILKALGFNSTQILMTVILQFSTLAFFGTIVGIVISIFIIPYIGSIALATTGLIWFGFPSVLTMIIILIILLVLINYLVYMTSRKVMKITPVEAISGGKRDVYFNSYVNIPLRKLSILPLNLRIGLKQLLTKFNQYMMLLVITIVLALANGITLISANIFSDFDATYHIFGFNNINVEIKANDEESLANIVKEISENYNVHYDNLKTYGNVLVGSESILTLIWKDLDKGNLKPIKGRFPKYENEVSLTRTLSNYFDKKIGDTLIISDVSGKEKLEFIVTGYHQNVNNMGKNIFLSSNGLKRIDRTAQLKVGELLIDQTLDIDKVVNELEQKYENATNGVDIYRSDFANTTIISVRNILSAVALGILVLVSLIISIITMLLAFIVLYKENSELGVYKALGYGTLQMRLQFSARFGTIAFIGALLGSILCSMFGADLLVIMIQSIGLGELNLAFDWINALTPIGVLSIVAFIIAFFASKRIDKVSSRDLIFE